MHKNIFFLRIINYFGLFRMTIAEFFPKNRYLIFNHEYVKMKIYFDFPHTFSYYFYLQSHHILRILCWQYFFSRYRISSWPSPGTGIWNFGKFRSGRLCWLAGASPFLNIAFKCLRTASDRTHSPPRSSKWFRKLSLWRYSVFSLSSISAKS